MNRPRLDDSGRLSTHNEFATITDPSLPSEDPYAIPAKVHCQTTDSGERTNSGLWDPKMILTDGVRYNELLPSGSCDLCAGGDMIPANERFKRSRYKPT